ncbi:MAG: substrate-binding domain-containing protein [Pseudomonadota bacterium]
MTARAATLDRHQNASRVTISDVAAALDVTKSTVSRALNGYPDISPATQMRVKRMAEQMNYQPLSQAQAIKTGLNRSLGFILQLADHDAMRPFLTEFLAGMSAGASVENFTLTVASADTDADRTKAFRDLMRDGKADGFILPRALVDDPRVALLREANVPFVLYGRQSDPTGCAWFDVRGEDAMRDAVLHLAGLGHRRIGFINGGMQYAYATLRAEGFQTGMRQAGLSINTTLMREGAVTLEDGVEAGAALLDAPNPPSAIICAIDHAALGVYRAAEARGLRIGRDLSVTGYDGTRLGAQAQPPLTTYSVDNREAGQRLAALLIRRIRGDAPEDLRETVPATFTLRGSTGPAAPNNLSSSQGRKL